MSKKKLIYLILVVTISILTFTPVNADISFGIDATSANWKDKNDAVWVVIYKVPYSKRQPSEYNGTIKYDSSAFTFNYSNDYLSIYAGDLLGPCEGYSATNNEELGEITLSINKAEEVPLTTGSAPMNVLFPFLKKEGFDSSKEYEFSYINDIYGEKKIIIKFDENGEVEVVTTTTPRFDFITGHMQDVDPLVDNTEKEKQQDSSEDNKNVIEDTNDISEKIVTIGEDNKKNNSNNIVFYCVIGGVIIIAIAAIIIYKRKNKKINKTIEEE